MIDWFHPSLLFLLGALLVPFLRGKGQKILLVLIPVIAFAVVASMSQGTYGVYNFIGIEMIFGKVDKLSLVFSYVFTIMAFIGMIYALHVDDVGQHMAAFLYAGSSLGALFAGDYFTLFIFWEIMAFASAYLIFARRERPAVEAGFRYILVHIFGGVCLLGGIILHYIDTGSILFGPLAHDGSLSFYLILIGFMVNAAVVPLSAWLPDAYPEATVTGTVFLSVYTTKVGLYVLLRAFPGTEMLIWLGTIMAIYGIVYATLENDCRRLLAYHMISQLGYMVAGVGIGTEIGMNGATAHAFAYIIYKGLLFMAAGAVVYMTGVRKLSEMGGLYKTMPITFILYMIGGFSISAFPLFSGFVSKSMVIAAASHDHMAAVTLLLTMASSGTFLSTTLKLPYHMFFGHDSGVRVKEPPINMLIGMGIAAFLCIAIGVFPDLLYSVLPYPVHFEPYTAAHITESLGILMFTALGFFMLLHRLHPEKTLSLDTDWFYRKGTRVFMWVADRPIGTYEGFITEVSNTIVLPVIYAFAGIGLWIDRNVVDWIVNSVADFVLSISASIRKIQTGFLRHYAIGMVVGIMVIIIIYSLIGGE